MRRFMKFNSCLINQRFVYFIKNREIVPGKFAGNFPDSGYTLLEMLFALSLFLLILSFITSTVSLLRYHGSGTTASTEMTWTLFVQQTKKEMREALAIDIGEGVMDVLIKGEHGMETISYEQYGYVLRRRVNGAGHEVLLYDVTTFTIKPVYRGVQLTIEHENGNTYETTIHLPQTIPITTR